jgi:hypothetical protein
LPRLPCAATQYIDSSEILGVTCRRYRRTWQEPDGQSATEDIWMAPAIGCEIVQSRCEWSRGGTLTSTFERIPKEISIGPPDDSLFTIPAHYEEVPPSRQMDLLEAASISLLRGESTGPPRKLSPHDIESRRRRDQKYFESQQYKPGQP